MSNETAVFGTNANAPFTLKVHRGDGMALLAMDWRNGPPPDDFVGFAIESREPGPGKEFFPVNNRLDFDLPPANAPHKAQSSLLSPFQYFRWVHFPFHPELPGDFTYRVSAVFMDARDKRTYSPAQEVDIVLARETCPGQLNVSYTRGFISSQAFTDRYCKSDAELATLLPGKDVDPLTYKATHPQGEEAHAWMGFEARSVLLKLLDEAIADPAAQVRAVVFDLNLPEVVERFEQLGNRLRIIIDDSTETDKKTGEVSGHGIATSPESRSADRLRLSAGAGNVKRQHMGSLQHNKMIAVQGTVKRVLFGSTNLTWRGVYVQNNHAVTVQGDQVVGLAFKAFDGYWNKGTPAGFGQTPSCHWQALGLPGIDAQLTFSPRSKADAIVPAIAKDVGAANSSLFYSLAFLGITPGKVRDTIKKIQDDDRVFSFGIADTDVAVLRLTKPSGLVRLVHPEALGANLPEPFKPEIKGGSGARLHHKFMVVDFDEPGARVYFGSFNFSVSADNSNGENLLLIKDRRIATTFMIEAVRIFDHYSFRVAVAEAKKKGEPLLLKRPPKPGEHPWWHRFYNDPFRIQDRQLFSRTVPGSLAPATGTGGAAAPAPAKKKAAKKAVKKAVKKVAKKAVKKPVKKKAAKKAGKKK